MDQVFELSHFYTIDGIGAASGLVWHDDRLYIISDYSTFLYQYEPSTAKIRKIPLTKKPGESMPKREKADFEAITCHNNQLMIMGSGSTEKRNNWYSYHPESEKVKMVDRTELYARIKTELQISAQELNLEGLIVIGQQMLLFQRGYGASGKNGIISVTTAAEKTDFMFYSIQLPAIDGVPATFTDAILVDEQIYFLAAAEDTTSTYEDGAVLGSMLGVLDIHDFRLLSCIQISNRHKFEGLTLYKKSKDSVELLLCEDNDSNQLTSIIYKLTLKRK